ncbi:facilitated trehalose transporter Tret1-like isoform X1 [Drosophila bipectinata]|uniref:facilitated trehalose transporter Tret1-like isoform X1 n=2 Tax=Drosophila bipectinata TaxID=42026 RepID=UPI001C8AC1C1|nr:facilitated trehalose transporter Tret1-like [Drosophila bipectinata]
MANLLNNRFLKRETRYQFLATIIVNIITFAHGIGLGWLSPTLTKIQTTDSPLDFAVNIDEISWLGSMLGLGSLCGNLVIGFLLERAGRKFFLYLLAAPYACLWILIYCASNVYFLYAARFLGGFIGGVSYVVLPIFISEIADTSIRGSLTSILMLSVNLGVLVGYISSSYLDYHVVPLVAIFLPIVYFLATLMLPESAPYLLKKNQLTAAEMSFRYYKNQRGAKQNSMDSFQELKLAVLSQQMNNRAGFTLKDFITKPALKGFAAAFVLCTGFEFSNVFSFINYMSDIFAKSGSFLDVDTCTIIIGLVQVIGVYTSTIFVDIVGRRLLLLISTLGVGVGCMAFGCFTYFGELHDLHDYTWIPFVLMIFIIYVANVGLIGLFFLVIVEVHPAKIRSVATSISVAWMSILVFVTLKLFPLLLHFWGMPYTMWFSAMFSLVTFFYFLFFLSETKGKSMIEE